MALTSTDLDAYLARISFTGSPGPTVDTLHALARAHVSAIPFENLDVLLDRPIRLELDRVVGKLVHDRRGGYCFEQNGLMLEVLTALGFRATPLSARVRLQRPRDFTPPRTHLFTRVDLGSDGSWLVDVGVGGLSVTSALRLAADEVQPTPHEPRRLIREEGRWFHQARLGDEWADVCEFTGEEMPPIDREVANWYTSAHPGSHFRNRLIAARASGDGVRLTLVNRELSTRGADGKAVSRTIQDPEELLAVLRDTFALELPAGTRFRCEGLDWR